MRDLERWLATAAAVAFGVGFLLVPIAGLGLDIGEAASPTWLELRLIAQTFGRLATIAAAASVLAVVLAIPVARVVPAPLLVAAALVSVQARALGWLAIGGTPGAFAVVAVHTTAVLPFAALFVRLRYDTLPAARVAAAADLGARPSQRFAWVVLPHLRPALGVALAWGVVALLGDVVIGSLAGGGKVYGPGLLVRDALLRERAPTRAWVVLLLLAVVAVGLATFVANELEQRERIGSRGLAVAAPEWVRALAWTAWCLSLAPLLGLFADIGMPGSESAGLAIADTLAPTALVAVLGAAIAAVSGGAIAIGLGHRASRTATVCLLVPLAMPSALVGAAWLGVGPVVGLRPGLALSAVALAGPLLPLGFLVTRLAVLGVPSSVPMAARDLGANAWARVRLVWIPAVGPHVLAAALLCCAWVVAEAGIPAFTSGPGGSTLATALAMVARHGDVGTLHRWHAGLALLPVVAGLALLALGRRRSPR